MSTFSIEAIDFEARKFNDARVDGLLLLALSDDDDTLSCGCQAGSCYCDTAGRDWDNYESARDSFMSVQDEQDIRDAGRGHLIW